MSQSEQPLALLAGDIDQQQQEASIVADAALSKELTGLQLEAAAPSKQLPEPRPAEPIDLKQLIRIVSRELQTHGRHLDKDLVRRAMEGYCGQEWKSYAFFDPERNYTRNLIATDHETFTLMLLCWTPGRFSPVHDHAGSHCFMRVISETPVEERRYKGPDREVPDSPLQGLQVSQLQMGQVAYICDEIGLHSVGNPSEDEFAVTLHLYMPPYDSCKCFLDLTGRGCESYITYYSEHGELVKFSDDDIQVPHKQSPAAPPCAEDELATDDEDEDHP